MKKDSQNNPLISVIIPCYKVEKYLDRCLKTVVNQSYRNLEIILIDDGSPDNTGILCDKWAQNDSRIKVIHKKNEGLGFARNTGIEAATGEWIAFIDSDDYINLSMYEKLISAATRTKSDIAFCGHIKQMHDERELHIYDFENETIFEKDDLIELSQGFFKPTTLTPKMLTMSVWHAVYRHSVIKELFHSEREVGSEDIHFQVCALLNSKRVVFIPDALYYYCYNGSSLSHSYSLSKYDRYKRLNDILNIEYHRYNQLNVADYCVFIMAFATIRRIIMSGTTKNNKILNISHIVSDTFWDNDNVDSTRLSGSKRLFYFLLKRHMVKSIWILSELYCLVHYTLAKKSLE